MRIDEQIINSALFLVKPLGKEVSLKAGEIIKAQVVDLFPGGGLTLKVKDSYLPVRSDLSFSLFETVSLKVVLKEGPGNEIVLQLLRDKSPAIPNTPQLNPSSTIDEERLLNLTQKIMDFVAKYNPAIRDGTGKDNPPSCPSSVLRELKILWGDLLTTLENNPQLLAEKTKSRIQETIQIFSTLRGLVGKDPALELILQLTGNKIGSGEAMGIKPLPGIDLERIIELGRSIRNEILKMTSPDSGETPVQSNSSRPGPVVDTLKPLLDDLLKTLPADIRSLPKGLRNEIQLLLQSSLKGMSDNVPQMIRQLIDRLPDQLPDPALIRRLKNSLLLPEGLQAPELKEALENSGVVFEAKLKPLLEGLPQGESGKTADHPKIQNDLKAALGQIKNLLMERTLQNLPEDLRQGWLDSHGQKRGEVSLTFSKELGDIESLLQNVQTYQVLSKVSDAFYTYMPVYWSELKRGELVFKRRQHPTGEESYSCGIHLDLKRLGSVSVFIYMQRLDFFVTFKVDHPRLNRLIQSHLVDLKENFRQAGLNLKTLSSFTDPGILPDPSDRIESEQTLVSIRI